MSNVQRYELTALEWHSEILKDDYGDYVLHEDYEALEKENAELKSALKDCLSALGYIVGSHGELYGVGWDRIDKYRAKMKEQSDE